MSGSIKADALIALHRGAGFVIPNAWDAGSARILERVGFPAIATTSAGIAWACGLPDGGPIGPDRMLEAIADIVAAVDAPVTADLESGYGPRADDVAFVVSRAAALGAVGANLEDAVAGDLMPVEAAVERLTAAREAAPRDGFVLNARIDTHFSSFAGDAYAETIRRAERYVEAGADCIFVPGITDAGGIRSLAAALPVPLNVVAGLTAPVLSAPALFALGARRVSVGGSIARAAFAAAERAGRELLENGTLGFLDGALTYADMQHRFGGGGERMPAD